MYEIIKNAAEYGLNRVYLNSREFVELIEEYVKEELSLNRKVPNFSDQKSKIKFKILVTQKFELINSIFEENEKRVLETQNKILSILNNVLISSAISSCKAIKCKSLLSNKYWHAFCSLGRYLPINNSGGLWQV